MTRRKQISSFFARTGVLLGMAALAGPALACNLSLWNGGPPVGSPVAAQPNDPEDVARYAGLCAMQVPSGITSYVQDNSPGGIDRIRARFYVLADNSGGAVVYRGLNASDQPIFSVRVEAPGGNVRLLSAGAEAQCSGCAQLGAWNSIEIDWDAGGGQLSLWVNSDATTDAADATAAFSSPQTVSSVRLGNLNSASGTMNFDAYESRRTTAIGRLLLGDANADADINVGDITAVANERFDNTLSTGQPDCNEDGAVDVGDITCLANIIFG